MNWKNFISNTAKLSEIEEFQKVTFSQGATSAMISGAEKELKIKFPQELKSLLQETNGVKTKYGYSTVFDVETIVKHNKSFRTYKIFKKGYMPFDCLLFFGEDGNGDFFAYSIVGGKVKKISKKISIFFWDHENDSREWKAGSLKQFISVWFTKKYLPINELEKMSS